MKYAEKEQCCQFCVHVTTALLSDSTVNRGEMLLTLESVSANPSSPHSMEPSGSTL